MAGRLNETDALDECLGGEGSELDTGDQVSKVENCAESKYLYQNKRSYHSKRENLIFN